MYYKNIENKPYFEPSEEIIIKDGLTEITEEEFNQIIFEINTPNEQQVLEGKINEAKLFLDTSDKKVLPDYEFRIDDNSLEWYISERKKARDFIRANTSTL